MPRGKYDTLTEQMFYVLLCLQIECYGMDIMERVRSRTEGRVVIGPGTLYHLLDDFLAVGWIQETRTQGRRRCYRITDEGKSMLEREYRRLRQLTEDYVSFHREECGDETDKKTL